MSCAPAPIILVASAGRTATHHCVVLGAPNWTQCPAMVLQMPNRGDRSPPSSSRLHSCSYSPGCGWCHHRKGVRLTPGCLVVPQGCLLQRCFPGSWPQPVALHGLIVYQMQMFPGRLASSCRFFKIQGKFGQKSKDLRAYGPA